MRVEGIILAAGFSSRAGVYKMLSPIRGKPIIERCIESMYDICEKIIVISGYKAKLLEYLESKYFKVIINENLYYSQGMFSSVIEGLKATEAEKLFITPGDYPAIRPTTFRAMISIECNVLVPVYHGINGHPLLVKRNIVNNILNSNFTTLRDCIENYGYQKIEINDPGILMDVDFPNDFCKINRYLY